MTDGALLLVRRNHRHTRDLAELMHQRMDARRGDAVIVGDKNVQHTSGF